MKKTACIIILTITLVSCSVNKGLTRKINSKFKIDYPEIVQYSKTKYQEKLRKRILKRFLSDFELEKSKLYVVENFQSRGGHHVFTKYQTATTYFFQNGILKEVYHINDENKLEVQKKEYWGSELMIPTLKFIQKKMELNQLDSIKKKYTNHKNYVDHAGEFFITELDEKLNIIKVVKCVEFGIE